MASPLEKLTFTALLALEELADEAGSAPLPRSFALRFTLAFLYSRSDRLDRTCFDDYWREATRDQSPSDLDATAAYIRGTYMRMALIGICKAVGVERRAVEQAFANVLAQRARRSADYPVPRKRLDRPGGPDR